MIVANNILPTLWIVLILASCKDKDGNINAPLLQNDRRIECERNSSICDGKDAMRFYINIPRIQLDSSGSGTVAEVWYSFVVCCDSFTVMLDSLSAYASQLDTAIKYNQPFRKADTVGGVPVSVGMEYYGEMLNKRWEWLWFGSGDYTWSVPTGEHFAVHKKELEEAHRRCCLE